MLTLRREPSILYSIKGNKNMPYERVSELTFRNKKSLVNEYTNMNPRHCGCVYQIQLCPYRSPRGEGPTRYPCVSELPASRASPHPWTVPSLLPPQPRDSRLRQLLGTPTARRRSPGPRPVGRTVWSASRRLLELLNRTCALRTRSVINQQHAKRHAEISVALK